MSNIRKKTLPVFLFAPLPLPIALISRFRATLRSQWVAVGERNSHNWPRKEFLLWNCHWCLLSGHDSYLPLPFSPFSLFSFSCCLESSAKNHLDKLICTSISQWVSSPALLEFLKNESVIEKSKLLWMPFQVPLSLCVRSAQWSDIIRNIFFSVIFEHCQKCMIFLLPYFVIQN